MISPPYKELILRIHFINKVHINQKGFIHLINKTMIFSSRDENIEPRKSYITKAEILRRNNTPEKSDMDGESGGYVQL